MRFSANLSLWILLAVFINGLVAGASPADEVGASVTGLFETDEFTLVKFQAICSACQDNGHSSLPLELKVYKSRDACDGTGIYLNGKDLAHTWNGNAGHGSGTIKSSSNPNTVLSANWESTCRPAPCRDSEECLAQFLTVHIEQLGQVHLEPKVSFRIFLQENLEPVIRDISSPPWTLIQLSYMKNWQELIDMDCIDQSDAATSQESQPAESIEVLWNHLQDLKIKAHRLHEMIEKEEHKVRKMLQQTCPTVAASEWGDCTTLGCKVKISLSKVPSLLRQMQYKFGPLPSSLPEFYCGQCPHHSICAQSSPNPNSTVSNGGHYSSESESSNSEPASTTPIADSAYDAKTTNHLIFHSGHEFFDLPIIAAGVVLIGSISILTFIIYQNSFYCRRRRADRAARREERQTRRAYRSAARRLRWQQWWEGLTTRGLIPRPHRIHHNHNTNDVAGDDNTQLNDFGLPAVEFADPTQQSDHEPSHAPPSEPGVMQAEIWGFRQALEYVGELVRNPAQGFEAAHARANDADHEIADLLNKQRREPLTVASSTAGLSTLLSSRTSMMSLDTLETAETAPPSYHP
ncbi:hypothetical protein P175DRAFT_0502997 [Aspergillus ochraceoroseus IBT 24754]|uniref:Cytochrome c domain-containing protein n=1 Tax=Aspergillus ochraceoroseus IBT 24754 TaxID=1392256 RepID=A0A2T5LT57_9EURO|nr:uncharacterized protein P175DRAFT_0502997 [Aspergillus ochraceoroseus IBT 24754]PTU19457.1 hypothetical protein P175DRAFT_0502997 [Aspergillus ochraceoroseus IBT 24754]